MINYLPTIIIFESAIEKVYPKTISKQGLSNLPAHLLWMLNQIKVMDNSDKASRWIGYIARGLEELNILTNNQIQFIIRQNNKIIESYMRKKLNNDY